MTYPITPHTGESGYAAASAFGQLGCDDYGTFIFDGLGRICGSGLLAEDLFGAGHGRLTGQHVSSFVSGIELPDCSQSHTATSLSSLCENGDWQHFDAMDILGRGFSVELRISRRMMGNREAFVLDFRYPR